MFIVAINRNIVKTKGKYLDPSVPMFSFTTFDMASYRISNTDCHLEGINLPCILCRLIIIRAAISMNKAEFVKLKSMFPNGCKGTNLIIENCSNVEYVYDKHLIAFSN